MPEKYKELLKGTIKELAIMLPIFFVAIVLATVIEIYASGSAIQTIFQDNWLIAIPILAVLASIIPLPRYADYPIAFALFLIGAGYGAVFVILSAESIGDIVRNITESRYFGIRYTIARTVLSIILITLGGFLLEAIL